MNFPTLGSLGCMPRPKIMRTSWTLRGRLQCILGNGRLKKKKMMKLNNEMKKRKPKGDEYIVSPCLRQKVENL